MTQIGSCNLANRLRDHNKQCALERNNELPSGMCRRPGNGLKIQPFVLALSVLNAAVANDRCTPNTPCDNLPALLSCGCPGTPLFNSVQWGSARKFFGTEAAASQWVARRSCETHGQERVTDTWDGSRPHLQGHGATDRLHLQALPAKGMI